MTKLLAKIAPKRNFNLIDEDTIQLEWDEHLFTLSYRSFVTLVRTLEQGQNCDYADCPGCAFVRVDRDAHDVWINNTCLHLNQCELRDLLNGALATETRLFGLLKSIPDTLKNVEMRPVGAWRMPRPVVRNGN